MEMHNISNIHVDNLYFRTKISRSYNDGRWHFVCLRWNGEDSFVHVKVDRRTISGKLNNNNEITPGNFLRTLIFCKDGFSQTMEA